MQLTEPIETINKRLVEYFGVETISGKPIWRVVFSEDQLEKRLGTYEDRTKEGLFIRQVTEVREVPKYRQWIKEKYVLERITIIPEFQQATLPTDKLSYEPVFVFEDKEGKYLPPLFRVAQLVIQGIYDNMGKKKIYKDPEIEEGGREKAIQSMQEEFFGNETRTGDALANKTGIVVPNNFKESN